MNLTSFLLAGGALATALSAASPNDAAPTLMRDRIERYSTDLATLQRSEPLELSERRTQRLRHFFEDELHAVDGVDFAVLGPDERIDDLLFRNQLRFELRELEHEQKKVAEVSELIPFSPAILQLEEARRRMEPVQAERSAKVLTDISGQISQTRTNLEQQLKAGKAPGKVAAAAPRVWWRHCTRG